MPNSDDDPALRSQPPYRLCEQHQQPTSLVVAVGVRDIGTALTGE
jgi:hypothetical protein